MAYQANIQKANYSDIFNSSQQTTSEAAGKRQLRNPNQSSSDFMSWGNANIETTRPGKASQRSQISSIFSQEAPEKKTNKTYLQKDSFVLGNEDTSSYNVKKDKNITYDPNKYFKPMSAYERKVCQFYGDDEKFKQPRIKGSIVEVPSEKRPQGGNLSTMTAKERNIQMFYRTDANGKVPFEVQPASKFSKNSTNTAFVEGKDCTHNQIESLKSNIFNDPDCEKRNNEIFAVKRIEIEPKEKKSLNNKKKKAEEEIVSVKLDWKDPKSALMRNQQNNVESTAHDRKLNDLFGTTEGHSKHILDPDLQMRFDITNTYQNEHPKDRESRIKKQMEGMSTIHPREYQNNFKGKEAERTCQKYEISNFGNSSEVNVEQIEKVFKSKGVHIFGTNTDHSYHDGTSIGKITFSIRGNNNDNEHNTKLNEACAAVKKETGLDIAPALASKKKAFSYVPSNVNWSNASYNQINKTNEDTSNQPKTHQKAPFGSERISNSIVNHTYKKK